MRSYLVNTSSGEAWQDNGDLQRSQILSLWSVRPQLVGQMWEAGFASEAREVHSGRGWNRTAVGAAMTLLVVLSVVDPILGHRFLKLVAAGFLVLSMIPGASTYRFVRARLIRRKEWWQA